MGVPGTRRRPESDGDEDSDQPDLKLETETELLHWLAHLPFPEDESEWETHLKQIKAKLTHVISVNNKFWQHSKTEALLVQSGVFSEKMEQAQSEISKKDASLSAIASFFEQLVADLIDEAQKDPKTKLMNFARFTKLLETFLTLEQHGTWCAVGLVDIAGFKCYNDALGHVVGDRIIERVADLLRENIRADDLLAHQKRTGEEHSFQADRRHHSDWLHARFGGDEFCFFIPDLDQYEIACLVADRFRKAVEAHDWTAVDYRLVEPVRVDVGIACLQLGRAADRKRFVGRLGTELIERADRTMYDAKLKHANRICWKRIRIEDSRLVDVNDGDV